MQLNAKRGQKADAMSGVAAIGKQRMSGEAAIVAYPLLAERGYVASNSVVFNSKRDTARSL